MNNLKLLKDVAVGAWQRFERHECAASAATIAFFCGLSLLPGLLVLIAILAVVFETTSIGRDAEAEVMAAASAHLSPTLESSVKGLLDQAREGSRTSGPLGLLGLIASALAGFAQLDRTFDRMSTGKIPKSSRAGPLGALLQFLRHRMMAFGLLCGVVFLVLATAVVQAGSGMARSRLGLFGWRPPLPEALLEAVAGWPPAVLSSLLAGVLIYRALPERRPPWKAAVLGAAVYALLWTLGREFAALYLAHRGLADAYGVIGSFLLIQLWIYYAVLVLLLGGEVAFEVAEQKGEPLEKSDGRLV